MNITCQDAVEDHDEHQEGEDRVHHKSAAFHAATLQLLGGVLSMYELHRQFGEPAQERLSGFGFSWSRVAGPTLLGLDGIGRVVGCLI